LTILTAKGSERFGYGDVFYSTILRKSRLRSEVEMYLPIQAEARFELETAFHWQSKRLGFKD
jgi:hypothetical protein